MEWKYTMVDHALFCSTQEKIFIIKLYKIIYKNYIKLFILSYEICLDIYFIYNYI